jgi:hypothetical protein
MSHVNKLNHGVMINPDDAVMLLIDHQRVFCNWSGVPYRTAPKRLHWPGRYTAQNTGHYYRIGSDGLAH